MGSYYHWTDEETYKSIIRKKNVIQAFFSWIFGLEPHELVPGKGGRDEYGEGVYFTDCGPEYARSTIAGRCFGHSSSTDQVECYFLVNFHGNAKITKEREHVWKLSPKTTAKQFIEDHGYHPDFESDDDDDDDDDEEDWVPSCTECGTDESVSDPGEDSDYYWCSYCECDIDDDGDRVEENVTCPWCGDDDVTLCTQDDDYDGQRIYTCCAAYFDENGDLWPEENPNGEYCRFCGENPHAQSCVREMCGNCCDGAGCPRHGDDDDDDDDDDWVPTCNECGDSDDVEDPGGDYYWCNYCECDIDSDGDAV